MTRFFQIIADVRGGKCACEILAQPCARCAGDAAAREHRVQAIVDATPPLGVIAMCDACAAEHLAESGKWRLIGLWFARAVGVLCFFALGWFFGVWLLTKLL